MKKMRFEVAAIVAAAAIFAGCTTKQQELALLKESDFNTMVDGKQLELVTLRNDSGAVLQLTNYGARVLSLWVPDRDGVMRDVVWGYDNAADMLAGDAYSGPVVGRYGNRISGARFQLDSVEYQLTPNEGVNQLHGGAKGWGTQVWTAQKLSENSVRMTLVSPDGDENYPGQVTIVVTYTINNNNEMVLDYEAVTDAATVINPTNHAYFNLHGTAAKQVLSHELIINASAFLPTDSLLIPTGEIRPVAGTPLDFNVPHTIGERVGEDYEQLIIAKGYDHNWVLNAEAEYAAEVYEPATGIVMRVTTDQPGMQFYSGNFMDGTDKGKRGEVHNFRTGIALETQHFPDSPNHPEFPTTVLRPGETYHQHTVYAFGVR